MNKTFRSIWNATKQAYVAAAETVSSCGRPSSGTQAKATLSAMLGAMLSMGAQAQTPPPPTALPTGGQVSAGQASIQSSGANMVVQQNTNRAAIDWQSFNVGSQAHVQFQQPGANSVILNRVMGADPSQIFGRITANGQVILTNPAGVYFSPSARVDVGGLIATTKSIGNADFMAGRMRLERQGSTGSVINEGELKASLGGYIALLAPEVRNRGAIIAQMGTVALASGEAVELHFDSNNRLTSLQVQASQIQALVDNQWAVRAPGGLIILSAQSMDRLLGGLVKNSGRIEATGLQQQDGRIVLSGSRSVQNAGTLDASGTEAGGRGGRISLQGAQIELQDGSRIDARGSASGGSVLVGGNWQGSADPLLQATGQPTQAATTVSMAEGARIDASATQQGDGGTVVLWSEVGRDGGRTDFAGQILARGGEQGGQGGKVETSGHDLVVAAAARVDTTAPQGRTGTWLLDPIDFTISAGSGAQTTSGIGADTLVSNLASSSVTIATDASTAGNGHININANIVSSSANSLTLKAHGFIYHADGVTVSTNGGGVTYWADSDDNKSGSIVFSGAATINTSGGNVTIAGGADSGSGTPAGGAYQIRAVGALSINTGGGDLLIRSRIDQNFYAALFSSNVDFNSGTGSITIDSQQSGTGRGMTFNGPTSITSAKNTGTAISITGTSAAEYGLIFESLTATIHPMVIKGTAGGAINITASGGSTANPMFLDNVSVLSASGAITLNGGAAGIQVRNNAASTTRIGQQAGELASSSSNITIISDRLVTGASSNLSIATSGQVTLRPSGTSFTSDQSTSRITWGSAISGLTLGQSGNTANITIGSPTSIAGPISVDAGVLTVSSALTTTNAATGDISFNVAQLGGSGGINLAAGRALSVNQSSAIISTYSGAITGTGSTFTKLGAGTLTLSGASSYTGLTTVSAGVLRLGAAGNGTNSPLGTIDAGTVVASGATLDLNGISLSTSEPLTITGAGTGGVGAVGALVNYNATSVTYSGLLSLGGNTTIFPYGGAINFSNTGTVTGLGHTLTLSGQSTTNQLAGILNLGTGGLDLPFTGSTYAWTLSGANTYTGPTNINGGTLRTTHSSALGNGSAVTIVLNNSASLLDISGGDLTIGSLASTNSSSLTRVSLGSRTLTIGTNNTNTTFAGVISGDGAVTKVGTGTLTLSGASNYTGATTVSAGTLAVGHATALGTTAAGTTVASGATLDLRGLAVGAEAVTINGGTLAANSINTTSSLSGPVVLGADSIVNVSSGAVLTLSGLISGSGFGLTKTSTGTLVLSGSNTYTGITTVSQGTLRLGAAGDATNTPLGTTAAGTVVASGAALDLNGFTLGTAEALTINGSGIGGGGALTNSAATAVTYSGLLTLGSNSTIRAITSSGHIVLTNPGSITGSGFNLTLSGDSTASSMASVLGTGAGGLTKSGAGTWTLTGDNTYTGTTTISAGTLQVGSGGTSGRLGSGTVSGTATSLVFNRSDNVALSALAPNAGTISIGNLTITGTAGITIDRNISATGTVTLTSSGSITGTANSVVAGSLLLLGGDVTLTHASNNVGTLAATGVGALTYSDSNALTIGTVSGTAGLSAIGAISVATRTGDLTLSASVSTTNSSANAIWLNAGSTAAAGTSTGGNLIVSGSPTLTAGTGGIIRLMTGSVTGSTGLTSLVGSGTGRFRYNSDEGVDNFTTALSPNVAHAIYRESRSVTVTGLGSTVTYGDTLSPSATGTVNGDTISLIVGNPLYSTSGQLRYQATPYTLSSNLSRLGYVVTGLPTTLTVNRKTLTVSGVTSANKVYDGSTSATISGTAALQNAVAGDVVSLSGTLTGTFNSKDVATATTVSFSGLSLAGADAGNYTLTNIASESRSITAKPLSITAPSIANRVYDGSTAAGALTLGTLSGLVTGETVTVSGSAAALPSANAGSYTTTVSYALGNGSGMASNYSLANHTGVAATIDKATLTVRAKDDAKFLTQSDTPNFAGVIYTGFVNGETATVLTGSPTVTRTDAGTTARTYTGVLQPGGLSSNNYQFNYVNGDFTIVGSNEMLVRVNDLSTTYGAAATYSLTTAAYFNGSNVVTLGSGTGSITALGNNRFQVSDGAGGSATFTVIPAGSQITSGAGFVKAGAYQLNATNLVKVNAENFSSRLTMVGAHEVSPKTLTASLSGGISKVYDGNSSMPTLPVSLSGVETGDTVTAAGTGTFGSRSVGSNLSYTISNVTPSGADAGNYRIAAGTSFSGSNGTITRLNSVTWVGGSTGNWFDPANWAGGAVPDLANVANVVIPTGVTVSFNTSGAVAPADASQAVNLDSLGSAGSLVQSNGSLQVGSGGIALASLTLQGGTLNNGGTTQLTSLTQSGGSFTSTGHLSTTQLTQTGGTTTLQGNLTVSQGFSQGSSGSISVAGNTQITQTSGTLTLGNLSTQGSTQVSSTDGPITQASGTSVVSGGAATLSASQGGSPADITLDSATNDFQSQVHASGRHITLRDANALALGTVTARGNLQVTSLGALDMGTSTVDGNLTATSGGSNITQTGPLRVSGTAHFNAGSGTLTLRNAGNNLAQGFTAQAASQDVLTAQQSTPASAATRGSSDRVWGTLPVRMVPGTSLMRGNEPQPLHVANKPPLNNASLSAAAPAVVGAAAATAAGQSVSKAPVGPAAPVDAAASSGASANSSTAAQPSATGASGSGSGVRIDRVTPAGEGTGMTVAVSLPKGATNTGLSFTFVLPESVRQMAQDGQVVRSSLPDGSALPAWLNFDTAALQFRASTVPPGVLPMQVVLTMGSGQRVWVAISERAE